MRIAKRWWDDCSQEEILPGQIILKFETRCLLHRETFVLCSQICSASMFFGKCRMVVNYPKVQPSLWICAKCWKILDEALCAHHNAILSHQWIADKPTNWDQQGCSGTARLINRLIHSFPLHSCPVGSLWRIVISIGEHELSGNSELMPSVAFRRINVFIKRVLHIKSRAISCWKPSTIPWQYRHPLALTNLDVIKAALRLPHFNGPMSFLETSNRSEMEAASRGPNSWIWVHKVTCTRFR